MTKLLTKTLVILALVAPAGLIPASKTTSSTPQESAAITASPTHRNASMRGKSRDPFALFPGGNAFELSPKPLAGRMPRVEGEARARMLTKE